MGSVAEGIERIPLHDYPFYEIKKIVADPKPNSVIIMGSYNTDSIGFKLADQVFSSELSEISAIPIYSVYEYLFNYGIVGGSLLSGSLQGEEGAKLAIKILSGIPISELPVVTDKTAYYGFDYLYLEKFEIPIELLPVGTEVIINKPFSTFEQYRVIILTTFSVFIMLVVFIIILSVNIKIKKRAKLEIENSHLELIDAYGSLTNSELKLKSRNDSLQEQQERINFLAYNDYLTGLPNRLEIKRYAEKMMRIVDQDDGHMLLVFIDLDNFKYINTSYGHKAGDVLLEQLAGRFNRLISDRSQIGRLGGDEFVFLARVEDEASIVKYVMPIMQLFKNSFNIVGQSVHVSASMGYSVYPNDAGFYDDLLIRADMAMFKMKEYGKAKAGRFDMKMNHEMNHKISIINELHEAIERDEFYLLYQPQYDMVNDKIVGFEALIRWNSTKLGLICPDDFISIAESNGSIVQIGEWVIREAATFAKFININEDADIIIAINISVVQLLQRNFTDRVRVILNEVVVLPEYIEFELTESVFIESFDVAGEQLDELRNMGIQIALDDFGTGYSSLTYLKYLPITTLKIDRNFIVDIIREGKEHFFTQAIIDIGHKLGFRIIAEGVEEEIQKNYLIEHGCSIMQGYLFSKPVYFEEAIALYYECLKDDLLDA